LNPFNRSFASGQRAKINDSIRNKGHMK